MNRILDRHKKRCVAPFDSDVSACLCAGLNPRTDLPTSYMMLNERAKCRRSKA